MIIIRNDDINKINLFLIFFFNRLNSHDFLNISWYLLIFLLKISRFFLIFLIEISWFLLIFFLNLLISHDYLCRISWFYYFWLGNAGYGPAAVLTLDTLFAWLDSSQTFTNHETNALIWIFDQFPIQKETEIYCFL